jgi:hypothetical protein
LNSRLKSIRHAAPVPRFANPGDHERARAAFERAGYSSAGVREALGGVAFLHLSAEDLPRLLRRCAGDEPRQVLVRLFVLGTGEDESAVARALSPLPLASWVAAGLLRIEDGRVRRAVKLLPVHDLLLAYDEGKPAGTGREFVMGAGRASETLATLTIRNPVGRALDLGTGCGFQALLAARHADSVTATDRNPRAVGFARFNAALNGMDHVECREGDLFAATGDERFDLIVCNPPYVISPSSRYLYRDGGRPADGLCAEILRDAAPRLNEGGICQVLANWAHVRDEDWQERLAGWAAGTGCDLWVIRSETLDADEYASRWIRQTESARGTGLARNFERWMRYYDHHGIEAISGGLLVLRRRTSNRPWLSVDDAADTSGPCGAELALGITLRDWLDARDDDALLDSALTLSRRARLHQDCTGGDEGWKVERTELRLVAPLVQAIRMDPALAMLVLRFDGRTTLREAADWLASRSGMDAGECRAMCAAFARELIRRALALPPTITEPSA